MSDPKRDPVDEALAALPREVEPERDLWGAIHAQIAKDQVAKTPIADVAPVVYRGSRWFQLAAAVLLVLATSVTTYVITRESMQGSATQIAQQTLPAPAVTATPASFAFGSQALGAGYMNARAELDELFRKRVASLPPAERAKLERNLADLRHAADEISKTLAEHPSDPLLQDLLMSTYQSELRLLADVNEVTTMNPVRADL